MAQFARRAAIATVGVLLAGMGGTARAASHQNWAKVARVQADTRIVIYLMSQDRPEACDFLAADDSSVTCVPVGTANGTRIVFPRATVREIAVFEVARNHHIGVGIAAAITVGLVTALAVVNPLAGLLAGVTALGVWTDWQDTPPLWPSASGPEMHRRVVYRAAAATP